jgi:D-aminopeptidase
MISGLFVHSLSGQRCMAGSNLSGDDHMTKASDLLVAALENEGVDRIFGIPGEENLDIVESLRTSSIKLTITRHEQAAAFMAATHGRLTGRPGVCLATLGPGALNFATGAAYAHLGAMPMVMLTGQKGILSERQARFQIVDVVATMRPLTKMARQIVSAHMIPTLIRDASRTARRHRARGVRQPAAGPSAHHRRAHCRRRGDPDRGRAAIIRQAATGHAGRRRVPPAPGRQAA